MNHIFALYIGVFMYVYLDDVIIFSDSVEDYLKHIKTVFDVLWKECSFLSPNKMQFFVEELKILRHIVNNNRI